MRWIRWILSVASVAAMLGALGILWFAPEGNHEAVMTDMDGRRVAVEAAPDESAVEPEVDAQIDEAEAEEAADITPVRPDSIGRFQAPDHDLDVPLRRTQAADGVLNPPTLTDAFVFRDPDRRTPAGVRPRVIAMHAVRDGRAPGNAFSQPGVGDPAVKIGEGDELWVDGILYVVNGTEILDKDDATRSPAIWGHHPDGDKRLVVITCLPRAGTSGPAAENLVIHAVRSA